MENRSKKTKETHENEEIINRRIKELARQEYLLNEQALALAEANANAAILMAELEEKNKALEASQKKLEQEITIRRRAEEALRRARDELELRVRQRTGELAEANKTLHAQILERKKAEKKSQNSEKYLREVLDSLLVGIIIVDAMTHKIEYVNKAAMKLIKMSKKKIVGQICHKFICPVDIGKCPITDLDQLVDNSERILIDSKFRQIDILKSVKPIEYDGKVLLLESFFDITDRKHAEMQIKNSLKEKKVLLKEIHHRVKNNLQIISSLLYLQSKNIKDNENLELFTDSQNRVKSMALIHEKLYQSEDIANINFAEYIKNLTNHLFQTYKTSSNHIDLEINVSDISLTIETAIPCGLIINELVSNSLKYAFQDGRRGEICIDFFANKDVKISPGTDKKYTLIIRDNGIGFPDGFDYRYSQSLGLRLVNNLIDQLNGTVKLKNHKGTCYTIRFG